MAAHTNISSDGAMDGAHLRGYGAFPRVLAEYVRTQRVLSLQEAIHRMTGLSAAHVGLRRRGTITPGQFADLVLFDPESVTDHATPDRPHAVSTGIVGVWVTGQRVWRDAAVTGVHPGRVLRRATARD